MKIIIEGMDNSGKTTLAAKLSSETHMPFKHSGGKAASQDEILDRATNILLDHRNYIYDRIPFISGRIYGSVLRGEDAFAIGYGKQLFDGFRMRNPLVIYCRPPSSFILDFGDREQMAGVIENSQKLLAKYDEFIEYLSDSGMPVFYYDFTKPEHYDILMEVVKEHG